MDGGIQVKTWNRTTLVEFWIGDAISLLWDAERHIGEGSYGVWLDAEEWTE